MYEFIASLETDASVRAWLCSEGLTVRPREMPTCHGYVLIQEPPVLVLARGIQARAITERQISDG